MEVGDRDGDKDGHRAGEHKVSQRRRVRATGRGALSLLAVLALVVGVGVVVPGAAVGALPDGAVDGSGVPGGEEPTADEGAPNPIEQVRAPVRNAVTLLDDAVERHGELQRTRDELAEALGSREAAIDALVTGELATTQLRVQRLATGITGAESRLGKAREERSTAGALARRVALDLYVQSAKGGLGAAADVAVGAGPESLARRARAAETVRSGIAATMQRLESVAAEIERLERGLDLRRGSLARAEQRVEELNDEIDRLRDEAGRMAGRLAEVDGQLSRARSTVGAAQDQIAFLLTVAGSPANRAFDPMLTIRGGSRLTADQLVAWFSSYSGGADPSRVAELASLFVTEGEAVGVRGDVAFVQAVLETGGFRFTGSHNYAGIGHCDSCDRGFAFASARDGVRAQVQMLRAYADAAVRSGDLPGGPVPGVDVERLGVRGCCVSWWGLTGVWATALHYGGSILALYESALAHAAGSVNPG